MIPIIENCSHLSRKNNIIFANLTNGDQVPLVRLKQNFIEVKNLEGVALEYMEKYMKMHPDLWEFIDKKEQQQLTLF